MLEQAITATRGAGMDAPVLVIGAFADEILQTVKLVAKCQIIHNLNFAQGQATSLIAGVRAILGKCDAALFMLADQPFIDAPFIIELMNQYVEHKPDLLCPVYRNQRGNPVIISAHLFPRLLHATGDQGARFLFADETLNRHAYEVNNKAIITDVDTWDDYLTALDTATTCSHLKEEDS